MENAEKMPKISELGVDLISPSPALFNMVVSAEGNIRKVAESISIDLYEAYLRTAINNDMLKISYLDDTYKYLHGDSPSITSNNQKFEIGTMWAYERIAKKSKHCLLIRIPDRKFDRFYLEASNIPLKMDYIGQCFVYGIQ